MWLGSRMTPQGDSGVTRDVVRGDGLMFELDDPSGIFHLNDSIIILLI